MIMGTNIVQCFTTPGCRYLLSIWSEWPTRNGQAELDIYNDTGEGKEAGKEPYQKGQAYTLRV